jgi:hypothetical protein
MKISEWLRKKIKYESDNLTEDEYKAYCECNDALIEILNENKIDPYQG